MKLSSKVTFTIVTFTILLLVNGMWNLIESPTRGAIGAAQLDDTAQSFIIAKALNSNYVEAGIFLGWLFTVGMIWLFIPLNKTEPIK